MKLKHLMTPLQIVTSAARPTDWPPPGLWRLRLRPQEVPMSTIEVFWNRKL